MAKVVIAGLSDCPSFARIELLADQLARDLPDFRVTKFIKQPSEWKAFIHWIRERHGWVVMKSPVVWRELVDQGGEGTLIGGADEFQEYVAAYYDRYSQMTTNEMMKVAEDNTRFKQEEVREKQEEIALRSVPSSILIFGASSPAAVHLLPYLAKYGMFLPQNPISLHLYDEDEKMESLIEIKEALVDLAAPMLEEVKIVTNLATSLANVQQVIFLDVIPRIQLVDFGKSTASLTRSTTTATELRDFEPRQDWLRRRYAFFASVGLLIKANCQSSVRILVCGNPGMDSQSMNAATPVNFDVAVLHKIISPEIPARQIVGLSGPIEQRVKAVLATKVQVHSHEITDVIIWGNIGARIYIDLSRSQVYRRRTSDAGLVAGSWFPLPTVGAVRELDWLSYEMQTEVSTKRTKSIRQYIGLSHAQAVIRLLQGWWTGSVKDKENIYSLVVVSEDWYGVPPGVAFSFPVVRRPTLCWSVVQDVEISPQAQSEIEACVRDVLEDWSVVDPSCLDHFIESGRDKDKRDVWNEMSSEE